MDVSLRAKRCLGTDVCRLSRMFGEEIVEAFGRVKAIFDPRNLMNPGKVVAPYRLDENLRFVSALSRLPRAPPYGSQSTANTPPPRRTSRPARPSRYRHRYRC